MIRFKVLHQYSGMFEKCYCEITPNGLSLFDKQNKFVGEIIEEGFSINSEYEHAEMITRDLIKKGIHVFDFDTYEEIKHEQELAELLYGD